MEAAAEEAAAAGASKEKGESEDEEEKKEEETDPSPAPPKRQKKVPRAEVKEEEAKERQVEEVQLHAAGEYRFSPEEALEPIAPSQPLRTSLPFHPDVRAHLDRYGIAVIEPPFIDQATFLKAIDPRALQPESYRHGYRMALGCFNQQEEADHSAVRAAFATESTLHPPAVKTADVLDLLERQWKHISDSSDSAALPRLEATENRIYVKDVAASDQKKHVTTFTSFNAQQEQLQQRLEAAFEMAEVEPSPEENADDDPETTEYLRAARSRLELMGQEYRKRQQQQQQQGPLPALFHALHQDEISLHPDSLVRLSSSSLAGIENSFAYLKKRFQFFNLVRTRLRCHMLLPCTLL